MNKPGILIAFGMLLGASIGFADGVVGLHVWQMLGQPDFFIRRNWGEEIHIISLTFSGALAGLLYGGFMVHMSHSYAKKLRLGFIYCSSLATAILVFFCAHYYIIAHRVPLTKVVFIPEIAVFVFSIVVAVCTVTGKRRMPPEVHHPKG